MRPSRSGHRQRVALPMAAMIDVVFLLLIYFLWTTGFEPPEYDWGGRLTSRADENATAPAVDDWTDDAAVVEHDSPNWSRLHVRVGLDAAGRIEISLNDRLLASPADLADRFRQVAGLGLGYSVVISSESGVSLGQVMAVHDALLQAGGSDVSLALEIPEG